MGKVKQDPTLMKLKLAELNRIAQSMPKGILKKDSTDVMYGYKVGQRDLADKLRQVLSGMPKGYNKPQPSVATRAKERFLLWREQQAKAEWKQLPEEERKRWIEYAESGTEMREIREQELGLNETFEVGDYVRLHHNLQYLETYYPADSWGKVISVGYDEVRGEQAYLIDFAAEHLPALSAVAHELRKV